MGFTYGSRLVWFDVLNATALLVLSAPPYNFSASMVGLSCLGLALGAVVSALWAGPVADKLLIRLARRNQGLTSITIAIPVSCNYAIDTYQQLGGQAIVTVIIIRNTMSFAINYGITPWILNTD
ncbi:hypothetical protein BGAL_0301g00010 [Botrytis galanthina]|uniref:Major facilitator superfamily (MFS) profile domain-containing protein n=1 Tax=Botrytis galanthina TaxID=278940 RepID=A0A4S8QUL1_9HELO|nr:hypothetical protein BGAL_0301g00010 [Botrytis galanthina]